MSNHIDYTTEQMRHDLHSIVRSAAFEGFKPKIIAGIARGGLQAALMLSHYYDAKLVSINVSLRDGKVGEGHETIDTLRAEIELGTPVLIIDDICDTGHTLKAVWDHLALAIPQPLEFTHGYSGHARTAVLWNNTAQDVFDPQYVGREINRSEDKRWIIFPAEDWWLR
jgi:hypoxanthine phosphoribosyltransferase